MSTAPGLSTARGASAFSRRGVGTVVTMGVWAALADVAELVWPAACGGCGGRGSRWCPACAALLAGPAHPHRPDPCPADLPPVWAVAAYDGPVRHALLGWKDRGRHDLVTALSPALEGSMRKALAARGIGAGRVTLVVPMPSRASARRARGADALGDLTRRACRELQADGWPVVMAGALTHRRSVVDQAGLDAPARAANLAGALTVRAAWRNVVAGADCLLVDDVVTTGSTLSAATAAIVAAGGHPFGVAVIAATQRVRARGAGSRGHTL